MEGLSGMEAMESKPHSSLLFSQVLDVLVLQSITRMRPLPIGRLKWHNALYILISAAYVDQTSIQQKLV